MFVLPINRNDNTKDLSDKESTDILKLKFYIKQGYSQRVIDAPA